MEHRIFSRYPIGNPKRGWKQDNFILSTFSVRAADTRETIENLVNCGFNLIETAWCPHDISEASLRYCEQLGVDILYQDFSVFGGMQERNLERHIDAETAKKVDEHLRNYRRCIGTYVWDEPYVHDQLEEARYQTDLFRACSPEKLAFTVAIPSYNSKYTWQNGRFADYLEDYCSTIEPEVLSLDYYPIGLGGYTPETQLDNSLMWCDLGLMRVLAAKHKLPLWFYYQGLPMHGYKDFYFPMVRCSMYAAAMYGAKGLQQYTANGSVIDANGKRGPFYEKQKAIHKEFAALGNTLMALDSKYVFHSPDLLPDNPYHEGLYDDISLSEVLADKPLPKRISAGELTDAYGHTYLLILNRDYDCAQEIDIPLKKDCSIYRVSRVDGHEKYIAKADSIFATLEAGDAMLLRLQDGGEEPYTLEYMIEK